MPQDATLSVGELVNAVLENNANLAALDSAVARAQHQIGPAGALDDPTLSYAVAPESFGVAGLDPGQVISLAQPLPWPGKRKASQQRAEHHRDATAARREQLRRDAVWSARSLFADWTYIHRALAINAAQQRLLDDLVSSAQAQYSGGAGAQHAVLAAELRRSRRAREQLALEAERAVVRARINALRNVAVDATLPPPAAASELKPLPGFSVLGEDLVSGHPALQGLEAQIAGARAEQRLARLDQWPDLRLTASWLGTLPREEYRGQVGIMLNLPFGQDKRRDAHAAATAQAEQYTALRREALAQLESRLHAAVARADAATKTLDLYRQQLLPLAEQSIQTAQADYAAGSGSVREVIDAEDDLLRTRLGMAATQRERFREYADIARISGDEHPFSLFADREQLTESTP